MRLRQNRKVRIMIQDGPTIEGILYSQTKREYVLFVAKVLDGEDETKDTIPVSGHVEIPRERVLWLQVVNS